MYNDPKGYRGSYESIIEIKDFDMSKKMEVLSQHAQWFEDNSPIMEEHKKKMWSASLTKQFMWQVWEVMPLQIRQLG